jgi:hypothetical protein
VEHDPVVGEEGVHSEVQEVEVRAHEEPRQELVVVLAVLQTITKGRGLEDWVVGFLTRGS